MVVEGGVDHERVRERGHGRVLCGGGVGVVGHGDGRAGCGRSRAHILDAKVAQSCVRVTKSVFAHVRGGRRSRAPWSWRAEYILRENGGQVAGGGGGGEEEEEEEEVLMSWSSRPTDLVRFVPERDEEIPGPASPFRCHAGPVKAVLLPASPSSISAPCLR